MPNSSPIPAIPSNSRRETTEKRSTETIPRITVDGPSQCHSGNVASAAAIRPANASARCHSRSAFGAIAS